MAQILQRHQESRINRAIQTAPLTGGIVGGAAEVHVLEAHVLPDPLATSSAPTSLAIDIARQADLKLVSFCREDGFVEYC